MAYPVSQTNHLAVTDGVDYLTQAIWNLLASDLNALQKGGLADFNRVVMVGPNANYTTIASGITAAGLLTPTALNPVCIYLLPGHYLNEPSLDLPNYVSLVGMGPELCLIEWDSVSTQPSNSVIRYTGQGHLIKGISLKRNDKVKALIRALSAGSANITIRNCIGYGPGAGWAVRNGEFDFSLRASGSSIKVINCDIFNPGDVVQLDTVSGVCFYGCTDSDIVVENTRVISELPTSTGGIDIGNISSSTNIAIRRCTLITGDGVTWYPIGNAGTSTGNVFATYNNMKYVVNPAFSGVVEHSNFVDVNLTI
ncbi:MAG: hypothetical protein GY928_34075 [Colwellia sp.]|nr:hypothetical protein [Colwellia sp.]